MKRYKVILSILLWMALVGPVLSQTTFWPLGGSSDQRDASGDPGYIKVTIPLNPAGLPGNWTEYEFKIFHVTSSTQEWDNARMVYFYQSHAANDLADDMDVRAYYLDSYNRHPAESRGLIKHTRIFPHTALADQVASSNTVIEYVQHYPSREACAIAWGDWMSYTNTHNLRASFLRYDGVGFELNAAGEQHWQPLDLLWVNERPGEARDVSYVATGTGSAVGDYYDMGADFGGESVYELDGGGWYLWWAAGNATWNVTTIVGDEATSMNPGWAYATITGAFAADGGVGTLTISGP